MIQEIQESRDSALSQLAHTQAELKRAIEHLGDEKDQKEGFKRDNEALRSELQKVGRGS